ncbi:MAG: pyruvate:ferredoxin (flavodoxin) oxidoreductase [Bacilli bacterium]|nr:pyruvate:ferredoxin (flavodoxin) oxidoreductase [Bacilli bacterium]
MKYKIMDGNEACSYVSYHFSELAGIYPITPASPMAEYIDKWSGEGRKNFFGDTVRVVEMQSEAGAIGLVHGALLNGTLATTYTASQGLLLMIPNMYKIAGELLPCVINVAARSIATHALSIFGDHQDIYATRMTGFAILASSSVQQAHDLTAVSYLSTLKGSVPFVNFFDGFRTSHELQKVELLDMDEVKNLIDKKKLEEFKKKAISNRSVTKGTNQNDDIYFQISEARNKYYDELPNIVNIYMKKISKLTGRDYKPFNYYGSKDATKIIVAMGSVCDTIRETIDTMIEQGEKVGLIEVHLYRPFSSEFLLKVLPKTVEKIAVLDRTKESGSHEPLFLDVATIINKHNPSIKVIGGRYGLASKNTTPYQIKAVYDFLDSEKVFDGFTIGIVDDVTNLSLEDAIIEVKPHDYEMLIYGFGSDGMVSASKDIIKVTGNNAKVYVQGYFEYDSKKSGGITKSHLRFDKSPIRATYYVEKPNLVVCTKDIYLKKLRMFDNLVKDGIFLLNTTHSKEEVLDIISTHDKNIIKEKNIKLYIVDANKIASEVGIPGKINTIMETIIFKISMIIPFNFAISKIKDSLKILFTNKGEDVIKKNTWAVDRALETLELVNTSDIEIKKEKNKSRTLFEILTAKEGNSLKVSELYNYVDGTFEGGGSNLEKRDVAEQLPCYDKENCIMCNMCSFVCPHGVIRPFLLNKEEEESAPTSVKKDLLESKINDELKYTVGTSLPDCTGCGLCSNICPGKKGNKAITMKSTTEIETKANIEKYKYLFNEVKEKKVLNLSTIKGSQFARPKFEFPGACAGCGETPYLKLLSQLFGNELVIANATGCSSIYGGDIPGTSWNVPWANSLFEDNAEFGMGMAVADRIRKEKIREIIEKNVASIPDKYKEIFASYYKRLDYPSSCLLYEVVDDSKISELVEMKEFIKSKSFWIVGGDGWAYDIGFGGLDHVLSTKENVNILVLDTEVYSNTGGQSSKSSPKGSVAKFTNTGKVNAKKDLARIALSYPHVYVATISLGANMQQAINALNEAKNYNGPSIVIAYAPCIAQGILKGMSNSIEEEKKATGSGYFPIFRYNPTTEKFSLDSKADFTKYKEFLGGENRYRSLTRTNPNEFERLLDDNLDDAKRRYEYYEKLSELSKKE